MLGDNFNYHFATEDGATLALSMMSVATMRRCDGRQCHPLYFIELAGWSGAGCLDRWLPQLARLMADVHSKDPIHRSMLLGLNVTRASRSNMPELKAENTPTMAVGILLFFFPSNMHMGRKFISPSKINDCSCIFNVVYPIKSHEPRQVILTNSITWPRPCKALY